MGGVVTQCIMLLPPDLQDWEFDSTQPSPCPVFVGAGVWGYFLQPYLPIYSQGCYASGEELMQKV